VPLERSTALLANTDVFLFTHAVPLGVLGYLAIYLFVFLARGPVG
jgi:hypothetical protein